MPHYQALGSKEKRQSFSNIHTHTDCILIILFPVCMSLSRFLFMQEPCLKELTSQVKQTQKVRKPIFTFSITCECLTYSSRILQSMLLFFKGLFQMRCQLSGSTCNWCQIKHNIQYLLSPPKPPAYNHSLHRFLSVFTVGHPSHGVDLLVGPSAGER